MLDIRFQLLCREARSVNFLGVTLASGAGPELGGFGFPEGHFGAFEMPPRVADAAHEGALGGRAIAFRTRPSWSGLLSTSPALKRRSRSEWAKVTDRLGKNPIDLRP